MAGKGGGAWKVAYADFVTAMMAFFLVMWITAQSKPVKQAISQYFDDPLGSSRGSSTTPSSSEQGSPLLGPYASGLGANTSPNIGPKIPTKTPSKVPVVTKPPKMKIPQDVTKQTRTNGTIIVFADDSAELDDYARKMLEALVPKLLGKPNIVEVRGHAMRKPGNEGEASADGWLLSYQRCLAVMKYLTKAGVPEDRIRLSQRGEYEPFTLRSEPVLQAMNSRVEVFPVSELANDFKQRVKERDSLPIDVEAKDTPDAPGPN